MALVKEGIKGIGSLLKRIKPKPKPKPKTRPSTSISKTKTIDPRDSFAPTSLQPILSSGKEIAKKVVRPGQYSPNVKQAIGNTGFYGGIGAGIYKVGSMLRDDGNEGMQAAKPQLPSKEVEVESSDALADILRQKTMAIANEEGREKPVFFDYVKAFPSSYSEKISRDPEFAKQMMAGFLAMMQPSEGFVPRNAIADFGQAAMAEEARQEDAMTDQEQLLAMSDEDISKLQQIQAGASAITSEDLQGAAAILSSIKKGMGLKDRDPLVDRNNPAVVLTPLGVLAIMKETNNDPTEISKRIIPKV